MSDSGSLSPELQAQIEASLRAYDPGKIFQHEIWWRDHQLWLQERGYLLRPRFRPDWIPSWLGSKGASGGSEDAIPLSLPQLMDATRISDGALVGLKRVHKSDHPYEMDIAKFLLSEPLVSDARNHTVPVYEVLEVPDDGNIVLLVMPFLRRYNNPRFDTVGEVIAFIMQIFQSVQFMHEHLIAHRDCDARNIMLDPTRIYPKSFHPVRPDRKREYRGFMSPKHYTRTQRPSKYYLIDYGIAIRYQPEDMPPQEDVVRGGDKTAPEFEDPTGTRKINPFKTDIYYLGNLIREDFLQTKTGFDFLAPLVNDMVQDEPSKRPTMEEIVPRFEGIVLGLSSWKLRSRVVDKDEHPLVGYFRSIGHWSRRIHFVLFRVPAIPMPDY